MPKLKAALLQFMRFYHNTFYIYGRYHIHTDRFALPLAHHVLQGFAVVGSSLC